MDKEKKEIKKLAESLIDLIGVEADVLVNEDPENLALKVTIDARSESGLLIGYHGDTLLAIQSFLSVAIKQKMGKWIRIVVDIGDYKSKQESRLVDLGKQAANRAKTTREPQYLYNLTPSQRRIIHLSLSNDPEIETESAGEGEERYLIVKIKS